MPTTRIFAGIDEAGLGPLLGPLTIGFSALRVPASCSAGAELWRRLRAAVTSDLSRDGKRLVVADSKVVFTRNERGRMRLENTALAFLGCGPRPRPLRGAHLLETLGPGLAPAAPLLERHPWYEELPARLPLWSDADRLEEHRARLAAVLARRGVELLAVGARVVPAGELNASYDHTRSKGLTLWWKTADLIEWLFETFPGETVELTVDRHGGRIHYAELLGQTFPFAAIDVERESGARAAYLIRDRSNGRALHVVFRERAEEAAFAVALASCVAKYVREVSMEAFNEYFAALQSDLRPTAGYTTDGRRWLAEAGQALARAKLDPRVLVRNR